MKRKTVIISRILMVLYIAALAYLCFGHFDISPKMPRSILGFESDKLVHFAMFLPFPILSFFAIGRDCSKLWKAILYVLAIFVAGCAIGALTELCQGMFTSYRTPDKADFKADAIALAFSSAVVLIIMLVRGARKNNASR